jgi:hypothetical protein
MPKEYQPKTKYSLPHNEYMQMVYLVRDYDRMKTEYEMLIEESPPPPDGMPRGTKTGDPTSAKALRLSDLKRKITAVEEGLATVPEEYRKSVYLNVAYRIPYDARYVSIRTYSYHKSKMMWTISRKLQA